MEVYVYCKMTDNIEDFKTYIKDYESVKVSVENKNSFREFEKIKQVIPSSSILFISSLSSLGLNKADVATQLSWFIENERCLVILEVPSTYEYGVNQPLNKAILETILHSILNDNKNIIPLTKRQGRNKICFPENWDELYEKWINKEISSKEFIKQSKLKKATFYNMLTEYKDILDNNKKYINVLRRA